MQPLLSVVKSPAVDAVPRRPPRWEAAPVQRRLSRFAGSGTERSVLHHQALQDTSLAKRVQTPELRMFKGQLLCSLVPRLVLAKKIQRPWQPQLLSAAMPSKQVVFSSQDM